MVTTYRSTHGNPLYPICLIVVMWMAFAVPTTIGFVLYYYLLVFVDVALANPTVKNIVYATTLFSIGPCIVAQLGGWLSGKSPDETLTSRVFWTVGPTVFLVLLCALYLRADYLQSFH